ASLPVALTKRRCDVFHTRGQQPYLLPSRESAKSPIAVSDPFRHTQSVHMCLPILCIPLSQAPPGISLYRKLRSPYLLFIVYRLLFGGKSPRHAETSHRKTKDHKQ